MRTMHFAAEDVLVAMEVNLKDGLETDKIELVIDNIDQQVKKLFHTSIPPRSILN
jgi:hypothetical protein